MLDNSTVQFLVLLGIIILVKKFGFTAIGFRKIIKGYLEVTEDQKRKIRITVKEYFDIVL